VQSLLCTAILSKMIQLLPNETIEDLQCGGYRIITAKDGFRFGTDAVLLAHFAHFRAGARVADFGTGSGILPILICARNRLIEFDALEIEAQAAWRAKRGISLNALESCVTCTSYGCKGCKKGFWLAPA
jgi:tRNA1Val (adenine37-N6)-methyltransferase